MEISPFYKSCIQSSDFSDQQHKVYYSIFPLERRTPLTKEHWYFMIIP